MRTITVDPLTLAQEIMNGRRITREDDLHYFLTCDLDALWRAIERLGRTNAAYGLYGSQDKFKSKT